jgi:phage baseplate assembly protein W
MAGLLIPFQRDQANDLANGDGAALQRAKIHQVLGTSPGELPWRTSFGAGIADLRHKNNDVVLGELARVRAREGLQKWIGGISVARVDVERVDTTANIRVHYEDVSGAAGEVVV